MTELKHQPEFMTVSQVAQVLQCGEGLVREMIRTNELASLRIGRLIRVPRAALEALAEAKQK